MVDFIHVGDFKTGTTWMQKHFYPQHQEIDYLGGPFENYELEKLLHELIDSRDLDFDASRIKQEIERQLKENSTSRKTGICREVFACTNFITGENSMRNAKRLHAVFGSVKIIFVIREQFDMIKSIYSQYIKMGGTLSLNSFICDSIVSRGLIERLKWHKQIDMYMEIFGEENVLIGLHEEFRENKQEFIDRLADHIGVETMNLFQENNNIINKGLTLYGVNFARACNWFLRSHHNNATSMNLLSYTSRLLTNESKLKSMELETQKRVVPNYGINDRKNRMNVALNWRMISFVKKIAEKISFGKSLKIPKGYVKFLTKEYCISNKILIEKYGLPMERYNYKI